MTRGRTLSDWARLIREQPEVYLNELYRRYRDEFVLYGIKHYRCDEDTAKDAFQEALIACYKRFSKEKAVYDNAGIKTFLFDIGKKRLLDGNKRKPHIYLSDDQSIKEADKKLTEMNDEPELDKEKIHAALDRLPEDCSKLLRLYFFSRYDMESIAREMGLKNANTAKSKKVACMKKLTEIMNQLSDSR